MEDNNLKDRMDKPWQTPVNLIDKGFLTSMSPLFPYSNPGLKSGAQENDCVWINLTNYNEVLWYYGVLAETIFRR
jgi:hypothetical protein